MTVPPQLTSSLPSFSYPASFRHPPPASSVYDWVCIQGSSGGEDHPAGCAWDVVQWWSRTCLEAGCLLRPHVTWNEWRLDSAPGILSGSAWLAHFCLEQAIFLRQHIASSVKAFHIVFWESIVVVVCCRRWSTILFLKFVADLSHWCRNVPRNHQRSPSNSLTSIFHHWGLPTNLAACTATWSPATSLWWAAWMQQGTVVVQVLA